MVVSVESEQRVDVSGQEGREQEVNLRNPSARPLHSVPPMLLKASANSRSIGEGLIFLFSGISLSGGVGWCVEANLIYISQTDKIFSLRKERERGGAGEAESRIAFFDLVDG